MRDDLEHVVGVRIGSAGKLLYFHSGGMRLESGEYVVVQSSRGPELARVVIAPGQVIANQLDESDLRPILRLATAADIVKADDLKQRAKELLDEARRLAGEGGFRPRLDNAEYTLDGRRLTIAFTSEERVEYRETARFLADRLGVRVDLVQVGARDRARTAGGYGICGRELCCANWLSTFPAISIRMAKDQELPLNPQKISGLCGRLLCCLSYEDSGYREMRTSLPKIGQRCSTPTGEGKVIALNILQRRVTLLVDGQRVEVGDRDLGLVVRWDTSSKSAEPPPSLTPAEAVAQGLMTAEEADAWESEHEERPEWVTRPEPSRGRLPAQPSRRPAGPPAAAAGPAVEAEPRERSRRRGRQPQAARTAPPATPPPSGRSRSFRRAGDTNERPGEAATSRSEQGAPLPSAPSEGSESAGPGRGRRRRGRRGRARGPGQGSEGQPPQPE